MLEIIKYDEDEYVYPCLLVLGCFDGIHIGHAELLKKAKLQAKINGLDLGVMMFKEGKGGRQVYTFEERLKLLEQFNVKFVLSVDYTDEFKKTSPVEFLNKVEQKLNVKGYMSGRDFRFGEGAKGKSSTLKTYAEDDENGVWYQLVKDVTYVGDKVSTTLIKNCIEQGNLVKADALLGRNYSVTGFVIEGAARGKKVVGFPTVNMRYPSDKVEVKKGVYKVICVVGEEKLIGIANYGPRPTFNETSNVLEAYIDGFVGTLYGRSVTIEFIEFLRDTQKFESVDELKAQLKLDLKRAKLKV
ncbi:MAG: riboflavin biosynthesis protein RibF [Clostridia bacterium]|nr:riboflavin biosynthesis protein RibF [Clostridia bacterium]MDE7306984.1 riboflavin biosynthesis protein RibF [Clostridia bacterium]